MWSYAETAVTVIAASIPVLRVLVREASKAYGSGRGETYKLSGAGRHTTHTRCQATARRASRGNKLQDVFGNGVSSLDDLSDRSILGETRKESAITQTTEVMVHYSDRSTRKLDLSSEVSAIA